MARWALKRLAMLVPLLVIVSIITFSLVVLVPGDPAVLLAGDNATPEVVEEIRRQIGADRPFWVRYFEWVGNALQGDLGNSLFTPVPVSGLIVSRLPITVSLAFFSLTIAVISGGILGLLAAVYRGRWIDRFVTSIASLGVAVPSFWLGMMLIVAFAIYWPVFPAVGYEEFSESPWQWMRHLTLPALALAATPTAEIARQLRASLVNVLDADYVRTARSNGLLERSVILKHALKNGATSVVTVIGIQASFLLGGSVIIERVFGIPGVGSLAIIAVLQRDLTVVQGIVLATATIVLVINMTVDLTYGLLNPKARV